jgi:hypothetical protein
MAVARGWGSTKLHLALIAMGLISAAYVSAGSPSEMFGTFTMGILGAAGVYSSAAAAEKFAKAES